MIELLNGLLTGMTLQLAIGPVFFYIVNLALQKTFFDGMAGVLAVTTVDYLYISLAVFGIGKLLAHKKYKKLFRITSSLVLAIFGLLILKGSLTSSYLSIATSLTPDILSSFISVFVLTISSPMTIVFFTSLFAAKAVEYGYTKRQILFFGLGTGLATFIFMGSSVVIFSFFKGSVPILLIKVLNGFVGCLLTGYALINIRKAVKNK